MLFLKSNSKSAVTGFCLCLAANVVLAQRIAPFAYVNADHINYVRTWDSKAPQTDAAKILSTASIDSFLMTTQFLDGLGRPIQTVTKQATPLGKDLVSSAHYDEFGREQYKYLPFPANTTGGNSSTTDGLFKLNPFQQDSTFSKAQYPGENYFYSQVIFEASPLSRVKESFAQGDSWVGTSGESTASNRRSVKSEYLINTASDSVRIWVASSTVSTAPSSSSIYSAGELYKTVSTDESQHLAVEYQDKEGKVILKKVQISASPGTAHTGWLCTYYVYDDLGNLRFVLQPKAVETLLVAGSWTISNAVRDELCFYYGYDNRNHVILKKVPGAGEVYMLYDERDRLVMIQDANMRSGTEKWLVTLYDELNRPIQTGLVNNSSISSSSFATHLSNASTSSAYPFSISSIPGSGYEELTQTGYDDYANLPGSAPSSTLGTTHITSGNFYTTYNAYPDYAQEIVQSSGTKGMVTWTKTKILGTSSDFLYATSIYDEMGRSIQVKSTNISGGVDTATTQYDFSGRVLRIHVAHQKGGTNNNLYQVLTKHTYDAGGRLLTISKRANSNNTSITTDKIIETNTYDELGQLKAKKIAPNYNSNAGLETLSYDYNIRGWMLGANRDYAKSSSSTSSFFGFDLGYDKPSIAPSGGSSIGSYTGGQYNGNIEGIVWKSKGDAAIRKYDFTYDPVSRLTGADFNQYTSSSFSKTAGFDFSVKNLSYDLNGNILTMEQRGWKIGGSVTIDSLLYTYSASSNKLLNVLDRANDTATRLGDFRSSGLYMTALSNSKTTSATDFAYDGNGNMVKDKNKNIETYAGTNGIEYNYLNFPKKITVKASPAEKGTIEYTYDAIGNKLKKITTEGSAVTTTLYMFGTYVNDTLQFLPHEEGRIRYNTGSAKFEYDYFLKDHLENVRMVLTEEEMVDAYPTLTFEDAEATAQDAIWEEHSGNTIDIISSRTARPSGFGNSTDNGDYSKIASSNTSSIGAAKLLKVMAGDKIHTKVDYYYDDFTTIPGPLDPVTTFVNGLLGSLSTSTILNSAVSGEGSSIGTQLQGDADVATILSIPPTFFAAGRFTNYAPKAFLCVMLFDEQFKFDEANSYIQVVDYQYGTKGTLDATMSNAITVGKNGYAYVYFSNETTTAVYIDNFYLSHERGRILEENHYYPFGLTMAGISSKAGSFGNPGNKLKYNSREEQGQEFADGSGLNLIDYGARMFDNQIGRWHTIDEKAEKSIFESPYAFTMNNPINRIEIDGHFSLTYHYYFTMTALKAYGFAGSQVDYLSNYASVYADHPEARFLRLNNTVHTQTPRMKYMPEIDYSATGKSQETSWNPQSQTGFNYNIWHAMRSPEEAQQGTISENDATLRGQEFGWSKIFESASQGKLEDLKINSSGIQAFGQGIHALQDSWAHHGTDINHHESYNDSYPSAATAEAALIITKTAIQVHSLLSGDFKRVKTMDGAVHLDDIGGMSSNQFELLMNKIKEYLRSKSK
jgi:RHS repeat-associated protein